MKTAVSPRSRRRPLPKSPPRKTAPKKSDAGSHLCGLPGARTMGPAGSCAALAHRRSAFSRALGVEANADAIARLMESWPPGPPACPHGGG